MKRSLVLSIVFSVLFWFGGQAVAGQRHSGVKHPDSARHGKPRPWVAPGGVRHQHAYPPPRYRHPRDYFYWRGYPSIVVIAPYAPFLDPLTPEVVTSPFFCILHNRGFTSRVGLLDHLSGTHRIALNTAAAICPDGAEHCIFPSHE